LHARRRKNAKTARNRSERDYFKRIQADLTMSTEVARDYTKTPEVTRCLAPGEHSFAVAGAVRTHASSSGTPRSADV
jgi:hypothetical protein